jgi:hypothetical protein
MRRELGVVTFSNVAKRFAFLRTVNRDISQDFFTHASRYLNGLSVLSVGDIVEFSEARDTSGRAMAINIVLVEKAPDPAYSDHGGVTNSTNKQGGFQDANN